MTRPKVGTTVELIKVNSFLALYHGARLGSLGIVTGHSGLAADDHGVLVDWGDGKPVRCDLSEIKTSTRIKKDNKMSKTFKSVDETRKLHVKPLHECFTLVIDYKDAGRSGLTLAPSVAPALCLAILEATGYRSYVGSGDDMGLVVENLEKHLAWVEANAAAEADRVKLEAEAVKLLHACDNLGDWTGLVSFSDLPENMQTKWLAVARAARELNKETGQ